MSKVVMIDIETLGTLPTSAIASIGAITFDLHRQEVDTSNSFYTKIDIVSCQRLSLTIDASTVKFWLKQDKAAKAELFDTNISLGRALVDLQTWWKTNELTSKTPVWCHGPSFDIVILENAFRVIGVETPWSYNSPRDTRTIYELAGIDIKKEERPGVFHNALDDCIFQATMVQKAYYFLSQNFSIPFVYEEIKV